MEYVINRLSLIKPQYKNFFGLFTNRRFRQSHLKTKKKTMEIPQKVSNIMKFGMHTLERFWKMCRNIYVVTLYAEECRIEQSIHKILR